MNIRQIIDNATIELAGSGIATPGLDIRVLLKHVLMQDEVFLITHSDIILSNAQYQKFRRLIRRRKKGEPIAYLTGHKEFYGLDFLVNKNSLIPRPETEILVENALEFIKFKVRKVHQTSDGKQSQQTTDDLPLTVLDLGTGSGCLIISLANKLKSYNLPAVFIASDISPKALAIAKSNARRHQVYDNIRFFRSDLFSNKKLQRQYDLILANLPYVPHQARKNKLTADTTKFEPEEAIFAKDNGTAVIKKFLLEAKKYLRQDGAILIELDPRNAQELEIFARQHYQTVQIALKKDLQGLDRCLILH